jgi:SAM-dependent methyltransferase
MVSTMKEIHRVLRPGGILFLRLPHFKHKGAFCDPTHKHFISRETLECFEKITSFIQISVFTLKYLKGSLSAMIGRENL